MSVTSGCYRCRVSRTRVRDGRPCRPRAIDFDREPVFLRSNHLQSLISPTLDKQGISNRFLTYFNSLDQTVGHRVVGDDKTVTGKLNESAAAVIAKTREVDQNRGVSKMFGEYYNKVVGTPVGQKWVSRGARDATANVSLEFKRFTLPPRSRCLTFTRRPSGLLCATFRRIRSLLTYFRRRRSVPLVEDPRPQSAAPTTLLLLPVNCPAQPPQLGSPPLSCKVIR